MNPLDLVKGDLVAAMVVKAVALLLVGACPLAAFGQFHSKALLPEPAVVLIARKGIQDELNLSDKQRQACTTILQTEFNQFMLSSKR